MTSNIKKQPRPNPPVVQSNAITEARYTLSLWTKKFLRLAISKIDSTEVASFDLPYSIRITGDDVSEAFPGVDKNRTMKRAVKELKGAEIQFKGAEPGSHTPWTDIAVYDEVEKTVHLMFSWSVSQHLAGMIGSRSFTKTYLQDIQPFTSIYTIRVYEMLMQFRSTGFMRITLEEFKERLRVNYRRYGELKRHVIEIAVTEINETTPIDLKWEPGKRGRKVTYLTFIFRKPRRYKKTPRVIKPNPAFVLDDELLRV